MKSLDEIRDEIWDKYRDNNPPKGQAEFYYKDNTQYWKDGFDQGVKAAQDRAQVETDKLTKQIKIMRKALNVVLKDKEGDIDFIKFKIHSILKQAGEV